MFAFALNASAQSYQAHAVYIYSFIKYVQWPANASEGDFIIGIVGDSPIKKHLEKMASVKKAGDRNIEVKKYDNISEVGKVDILFLSKESAADMDVVINKVKEKHVLLITEQEGYGVRGSNINFIVRDGRLAFEMNKNAMTREELKVSSELLKLAIVI